MSDPPEGAPGEVRLSAPALLVGRAAEQLALAATGVVLAQRLGPNDFAPIGVLLVVNSLALSMADVGIGVRVLRLAEHGRVDRASLRLVRVLNVSIAASAAFAGASLGGEAGVLVGVAGVLWAVAAEGMVRKSAALRWGGTRRVAGSEALGGGVLLVAVCAAWLHPAGALGWAAGGLVAKQVVELAMARPWSWAFGETVRDDDWFGLWLSQALAFAIGNLDYVVVGIVLGERALAVYVVAYRLANAIPSQVAFVAGRAVTVDLASGAPSDRQHKYERYVRVLFASGAAGAAAVMVGSPALALYLGDDWAGTSWALVVLVIAAPWRTVLGTAGTLAIVSGGARQLLGWETVRLVAVALLLVGSAVLGFPAFLACVVAVPVASTLVYHRLAGRLAAIVPWSPLAPAAIATLVLLMAVLLLGSDSISAVT